MNQSVTLVSNIYFRQHIFYKYSDTSKMLGFNSNYVFTYKKLKKYSEA